MLLRNLKTPFILASIAVGLSACVSGSDDLGLASVKPAAQTTNSYANTDSSPQTIVRVEPSSAYAYATDETFIEPVVKPRVQKTYLINGLASSVKAIGYGFTNLSKKINGASLHNYASFIESSTIIRSTVTKEIRAEYAKNPDLEINMIGISFGANIVTLIAADLHRRNIPVNYLVTMEGPAMVPIRNNVRKADHFRCTNLDCFKTKAKLARGNKTTKFATYDIKASHIPLANHADVHAHIIRQIEAPIDINTAQQ